MNTTANDSTAELTFIERVASWCHRRRRLVLLIWVLALPASFVISGALGGKFNDRQGGGGNTESNKALKVFNRELPQAAAESNGQSGEVVFQVPGGVRTKQAEITAWLDDFAKQSIVATTTDPFAAEPAGQISPDGTVGLAQVTFKDGVNLATEPLKLVKTADSLRAQGVTTEFGGFPFAGFKLPPSEAFGLLAAVIILLLAFGSVIAMGLPILTAALGVGIAIAGVGMWSAVFEVPSFVTSITGMIGLGVGIDYVLFIVTRYKDELRTKNPHDATVRAIATAGRAVVFAGCTVIISMLGMFLMGLAFINSIALAGATPVFVIVLASITLIPAMLGFVGYKIDKFSIHRHKEFDATRETGWHRWSRLVQRRAWPFALGGLAILVVAAIPLFSLRLGFSDQGNNAKDNTTRKAYDIKAAAFGPGSNAPGLIAVEVPNAQAAAVVTKLELAVRATPGVAFAHATPLPSGKALVINFIPTTGPQDVATEKLIQHLRHDVIAPVIAGSGATAYVGGLTAGGIDFAGLIGTRLPLFIGVVLVLSFMLLMAVFRSVLVPLKAVIMNLLSIGAAYGLVVAIFQWGWGGSFLGVGKPGPIEPWIPMMMFAIVFGLSMDYEVFLLSRIREEYDRRRDNSVAVVEGLASTARVITAAAAIMVCVFLGFALGDRAIKVMGVGLATAVFIDATIVRVIMVPATMELLGDRNWWMPRWLDRAVPKLHVESRRPVAIASEISDEWTSGAETELDDGVRL
jgi:putative drug exporter of the RND superfamily